MKPSKVVRTAPKAVSASRNGNGHRNGHQNGYRNGYGRIAHLEHATHVTREELAAILHHATVIAAPVGPWTELIKRAMDVVVSLIALVLVLPFLPLISLLIRLDSPGRALFSQERYGRHGEPFVIWKFRTMRDGTDDGEAAWASRGDERVTALGRWLRRSHIDELPQLWNVLKGDMSLVGPRPVPPENDHYLADATPMISLRYAVKPGIASWAAVNLGYVDDLEKASERLQLDLEYLERRSIAFDLKIMVLAVISSLKLEGQ